MRKSLFARYFTVCVSIIVVSITFLGAILLIFSSHYFKQEQYTRLETNVKTAATITIKTGQETPNNPDEFNINPVSAGSYYNILSRSIDATFFIVGNDGKTVLCTEEVGFCVHSTSPYSISSDIMGKINEDGVYSETGKLGGIYQENYYTVGVPLEYGGAIIGYVFASSSAGALQAFLSEIFNMFIISSCIVLFVAFIIIFVVTSQMVRPLREMAAAARQYGRGDFSTRLHIHRDDEIGQLALALNSMADHLSITESTRRSFTANVSHELKTPMTSIGGFIDGILDGTIPEQQHKKYLRIVSDEVKRLSRLVRSMLNLSKIEAGEMKIEYKSFNIIDVIAQTLFSFEQVITQKKIEIQGLDVNDVLVDADEDLVHQVVYNLMDNAIKFVNEGGTIAFNFKFEGKRTFIGIRNSGPGLSKEEMAKVFDRFYKTDRSRGLDKNGVGLGLYIVKTIVTLHEGDILVRSAQGEYTEFAFSLDTAKTGSKNRKLG